MKLAFVESSRRLPRADLLVAFALQGERPRLPGAGTRLPAPALRDFKGEFRETRSSDAARGPTARVLLVGLGKRADVTRERLRRGAALAVQRAETALAASAALWLAPRIEEILGPRASGQALVEGALMGSYRFVRYKSKKKPARLRSLCLAGGGKEFKAGGRRGRIFAEANLFVRDLQNAPANEMRPRDLAERARALAQKRGRITCRVLDRAALRTLGMGALLGVAQGSVEPPQLLHLVYRPEGRPKARIALVGKGLTFDSGGISIKPASKMWEMKYDMSGGAAVLGVFHALAELDLSLEVHGVVPCSENLPDAAAIKPGDVVTAMNGTTIEVLNTDAEGRLILGDALSYAVKHIKPGTIIDLATLTGAVVVALGHEYAGLIATSATLRDALQAAGEETGERLWPLPLEDFHKEQMKGEVADLKNIHGEGLGAGSSAGAAFLSHFVGDVEWAHLDIAGTAWGGMNRDWVGGPQGSGFGGRLLLEYLERRSESRG